MPLNSQSAALHLLYGAASDFTLWTTALEALEDLMHSAGANINLVPTNETERPLLVTSRMCPEACEEYVRDYMAICPRMAHWRQFKPDIVYEAMMITEAEIDRSPVYGFFAKQGNRYHIGSALPNLGGYQASWSFQRTSQQGHVQASDISLFKRIRPHLVQAITLANSIGSLQMHQTLSLAVLDRLPQGIIILGDTGIPMFANAAADAILSNGNYLRRAHGALQACNLQERASFARLVSDAAAIGSVDAPAAGGWLRLNGAQPHQAPVAVFAAPVTDAAQLSFANRPAVFLLIQHIGQGENSMLDMLQKLFGLTHTEARLASLLVKGDTLQQAADVLRQSKHTARIHLKAIFRKMDINRQQDLIGAATRLAAGIPQL